MSDKLLYENTMLISEDESGFDGVASLSGNTLVDGSGVSADQRGTYTGDIDKTVPKLGFANSIASKSLPAVLGFIQPISSPSGYVFAMKRGPSANIGGTAGIDDLQITRSSVNTGMREVTIDCTNELVQDINSLFGAEFNDEYRNFLFYDGTDIDLEKDFELNTTTNHIKSKSHLLPGFVIRYASWLMSKKTNSEFISWLRTEATKEGTATISSFSEIENIQYIVAELKAKIYSKTGKVGRSWVLTSPVIIDYLLAYASSAGGDAKVIIKDKRKANATVKDYNYVFSLGETDYYQDSSIISDITGTDIFVGVQKEANETSIYYTPYKEYFVQAGENFYTGQSNIYFRLRDAWVTNPLDTFDGTNIPGTNKSDFLAGCKIKLTIPSLII